MSEKLHLGLLPSLISDTLYVIAYGQENKLGICILLLMEHWLTVHD